MVMIVVVADGVGVRGRRLGVFSPPADSDVAGDGRLALLPVGLDVGVGSGFAGSVRADERAMAAGVALVGVAVLAGVSTSISCCPLRTGSGAPS